VLHFELSYKASLWQRVQSVRRALNGRRFDLALATFLEPPLAQTSLFLLASGATYRASYNPRLTAPVKPFASLPGIERTRWSGI